MASQTDYYEILHVHPAAHQDVIQAAYRRLALLYHPDRNPTPEATATMARINEAYAILSDPEKRAAYDRSRGAQTQTGSSSGSRQTEQPNPRPQQTDPTPPTPSDNEPQESYVLTRGGEVRLRLSVSSDGTPFAVMYDEYGDFRLTISVFADGNPSITMFDYYEKQRLKISASGLTLSGVPEVIAQDAGGRARLAIPVFDNAANNLKLFPQGRATRLSISGDNDDDGPVLVMRDQDRKMYVFASMDEYDTYLLMYDQDGTVRIYASMLEHDTPHLILSDQLGNNRLSAQLDDDGLPYLEFKDRSGNVRQLYNHSYQPETLAQPQRPAPEPPPSQRTTGTETQPEEPTPRPKSEPANEQSEQPASSDAATLSAAIEVGHLKSEVYGLLGDPTKIEQTNTAEIWYYGEDWFAFSLGAQAVIDHGDATNPPLAEEPKPAQTQEVPSPETIPGEGQNQRGFAETFEPVQDARTQAGETSQSSSYSVTSGKEAARREGGWIEGCTGWLVSGAALFGAGVIIASLVATAC